MSDWESIQHDVEQDIFAQQQQYEEASKESALEQCIYLYVEGESEEIAFRILLEEGLGINFSELGIIIVNYKGNGNLQHAIRIISQTLSHDRPIIFTFDDDDKRLITKLGRIAKNIHLFKIPYSPTITLPDGQKGGSFEESFEPSDFIDACFETTLLKMNPQVSKAEFTKAFIEDKSFYSQIVKFLQSKGLTNYCPNKIEIAESMATGCITEPETYIELAKLIKDIRLNNPVNVKI